MIGIVIAHHLDNLDFLNDWQAEFDKANVYLYICEDKDKRETSVPEWLNNFTIYTHKDIKKDLGKKAWIIPFKTSAIKSYGFYKAWQDRCSTIITIDNDCYPDQDNFINKHLSNLDITTDKNWASTTGQYRYTRGFPYNIRKIIPMALSHGTWSNVPDLDAPTQLLKPSLRLKPETMTVIIPFSYYYPMCGMNLAFDRAITPLMYFGLQGPDYPYDRFDDIWAGIFSKKILDHLNLGVVTGCPSVEHRKQSNVFDNLIKEARGIKLNEQLWQEINKIKLTQTTPIACYQELITNLTDINDYIVKLKSATLIWLSLFKPF